MANHSASARRIPLNRALFFLLALAVSMAAALAGMFLRASLLSLGFIITLALYGTLAWLFGRYERPAWWIAAPLLLLGEPLLAWTWSVAAQDGRPAGPLDYVRVLLIEWTPWKLILLLVALAGSWLGTRSRGPRVAGAA